MHKPRQLLSTPNDSGEKCAAEHKTVRRQQAVVAPVVSSLAAWAHIKDARTSRQHATVVAFMSELFVLGDLHGTEGCQS